MKRREFLKNTGAAVSIPFLLNGMRLSAMPRSPLFNAIDPPPTASWSLYR